jgi:hypothetical protein
VSYRRAILFVAVAGIAAACLAPVAGAMNAKVRVEASAETIAPETLVTVAKAPLFYDSAGNPHVTKAPNVLAALAKAAEHRGFTWEANAAGTFVTTIGGFTSLPDWSEGWVYSVNGAGYPIVDVAAIDFALRDHDQTLWAQSPDNTFMRGSVALVADVADPVAATGEALRITVKADNLLKVNSQSDYDRYGLTDPNLLETPAQFAPVAGATVHVGSATYTSATDGTVTVAAPDAGTSRVWAEKAMDATTWYVRSPKTLVNFADALALTGVRVTPTKFLPGRQTVKVSCTLSRAANVLLQVRSAKGKVVWSTTVRAAAGAGSYSWKAKGKNGKLVPRHAAYTMRVRAVDTWGRATATTTISLKTR